MPNLWQLAHEEQWYQNHVSCGNGTSFSVFGMFTGLQPYYWTAWDTNRKSPVLIDELLKQGYKTLLAQVRKGNPKAKVVFLCGSMLRGHVLDICKQILNEVTEEAHKAGDKQVYRFDFSPMDGSLGYGTDWHPSLKRHQKMADELTPFLKKLMEE